MEATVTTTLVVAVTTVITLIVSYLVWRLATIPKPPLVDKAVSPHEEPGMTEHGQCNQPSRDVPGLVCGRPKPCPYHTTIVVEHGPGTRVDKPITNDWDPRLKGKVVPTHEETKPDTAKVEIADEDWFMPPPPYRGPSV